MKSIRVIGEDGLCCALGERLVQACLPGWRQSAEAIDTRGVTRLAAELPRYLALAGNVEPVLCIADADGQCPVMLRTEWLGGRGHPRLVLRFAVNEAESWVLADREEFSAALGVPVNRVPRQPDEELDPKRLILTLATRSRHRLIREEMVSPRHAHRPGTGYNVHLREFVRNRWDVARACDASPSLARAVQHLRELGRMGDRTDG